MDTQQSSQITQLTMSETLFPTTLEYRLHVIKTATLSGRAMATIYDGRKKVFQSYGRHLGEAVSKAKRWVDEQNEVAAANDLHSA